VPATPPQTGRLIAPAADLGIHCGLCAERCPTAAWDMRKSDLLVPYAGLGAGELHPGMSIMDLAQNGGAAGGEFAGAGSEPTGAGTG